MTTGIITGPPFTPSYAPPAGLLSGYHLPRSLGTRVALALAALALALALLPQAPGVSALLDAAAGQRAVYRYDRALALYAQARALDPADPRPACAEGAIYLLQLLPASAASAYQGCVALAPGEASAWLGLGDALAATADTRSGAATTAWSRAAQLGSPDAWARLAQRDERAGQLDAATRDWAQITLDGGALGELAAAHLGLLALARGNADAARAHLARVYVSTSPFALKLRDSGVFIFDQRPPQFALDWLGIGHALLGLGLPTLALDPLRQAVALAPANGSAHAYYGYTLWMLGQRAAARPQIAAGLVDPPYVPFADYAAGVVALGENQPTVALAHFQRGLRVDARNPALWGAAGDAALASGQYEVAALSYRNAASESQTPDATITLIGFYARQGIGMDDGSAGQAASAAVNRFPTSEPLVFLDAALQNTLGRTSYAQSLFDLARQLDPSDPGPWYYLGRAAASGGDVLAASVDLNTAIALQPKGFYASRARAALDQLPANTF
ncbi:MAG TPA: hypothetical protein VF808_06240 [Ktedonobacterales bacterium]